MSRRLPLALLAALAFAAPAFADGERITGKEMHDYTDPQFAKLVAGAHGNAKKIQAVELTQKLFNDAMIDPNQVPENAEFARDDVNKVGRQVGRILDVVIEYERTVKKADKVRETDPAKADRMVQMAGMKVQSQVHEFAASMPMLPPKSTQNGGPDQTSGGALESLRGKLGANGPVPGAVKEKNSPSTVTPATPVTPMELDKIVVTAAKTARSQVEGIGGGGGSPNGDPNGTTADDANPPLTPGGGATSNGSSAASTPFPTIGQLLGINDPNSPTDAMTDARDRYRNGDIAGGLADATRAVELGGGAPALALRGGMELDLKNLPAAHSDAGQALQLDASNRDALAVFHLSAPHASVSAPNSLSFGGSAEGGAGGPGGSGAAGSRDSQAGVVNAAQPHLSVADLRREITNALRLNDLGGALAFANRALAQEPNNPALLNIRAAIEARMHDYAKAEADARAGLALAPRNAALLRTESYAQLRGGKYKDALASANELIALNPQDAYAYALRAHAYGSMGDRDAMLADLGRAAALDPRFAKAQEKMAAELQLPSDKDFLFLFPGEEAPAAKSAGGASGGRGRGFGLLVGASALGGLLLALGLLQTVLAPFKDRITSAFTRLTRGPAAAAANDTAQPASVNGLVPGLIRGQYEISRQIGMGGMGMVFAGTDRSLGRPVAIKKMREELRVNPQERARFVIEAKTVAALHHPSIVDIYAIAEDGPDVYLIFEYVDGKTVHDLVQTAGRLPLKEAARVTRAAADALDYAHAHGVVHRDMKPSNVMLDASGRVKVMDFGIARMAKDSMTRYSMTNTVVGTPPYMAPEQEQGQVRRESDVYALAVCAYEMLTGKLPFIGLGAGMLMNKINMSYVAPSRAIAGLPEPLDEVFTKAFQADPDKRYRTPKEFVDALESALPSAVRT
jgi:tetratricopeptide (TPR) repeat protein